MPPAIPSILPQAQLLPQQQQLPVALQAQLLLPQDKLFPSRAATTLLIDSIHQFIPLQSQGLLS